MNTTASSFQPAPSAQKLSSGWLTRLAKWFVVPAEQRRERDPGIEPELPASVFLQDAKPARDRER